MGICSIIVNRFKINIKRHPFELNYLLCFTLTFFNSFWTTLLGDSHNRADLFPTISWLCVFVEHFRSTVVVDLFPTISWLCVGVDEFARLPDADFFPGDLESGLFFDVSIFLFFGDFLATFVSSAFLRLAWGVVDPFEGVEPFLFWGIPFSKPKREFLQNELLLSFNLRSWEGN